MLTDIRLPSINALAGFDHPILYRCAEQIDTEVVLGPRFTKLVLCLPEAIWQFFQAFVGLDFSDYASAADLFQEYFLEKIFAELKNWLRYFAMDVVEQERAVLAAKKQIYVLRKSFANQYNRSEDDTTVIAVDKQTGKEWTIDELLRKTRTDWGTELEFKL